MREFVSILRPAFVLLALLTALCGFAYPGACTLIIHGLFPERAEGSLIVNEDGRVIGSALIGQEFTSPRYFWGRLSATSPLPYNAAASSASNYGIHNPDLLKNVRRRIAALMKAGDGKGVIPVGLVTSSASGLDPEISPAAAEYQVARVAKARGISEDRVREEVARFTENRQFNLLGEPRVNVLLLNLALDHMQPRGKP